jgi:hypothetical protein
MVENLYSETAKILNISEDFVRSYCCGGDEEALEIVTPGQLSKEIYEYYDGIYE